MANLTRCTSCNSTSCQRKNTCDKCNTCESCNTSCNGSGCNTIQAFCSIGSQSAGGFSFGKCVSKDEIISPNHFSRTVWNKIITFLNTANAKGTASPSNNAKSGTGVTSPGNGGQATISEDTNLWITASKFNEVATRLGAANHNKDDVIYGSYFTNLESLANNYKLKSTQCNTCNAGCNVQCNTCLLCNEKNCGSCNGSCESHNPQKESYCCSCNSCQTETDSDK